MTQKIPGDAKFTPVKCDVSQEEEVLAMFEMIKESHGKLDICINNAGLAHSASLLRGKTEQWKEMLDVGTFDDHNLDPLDTLQCPKYLFALFAVNVHL